MTSNAVLGVCVNNGTPFLLTNTTSGSAQTLWTAIAGTTSMEEIYIWAFCQSTSSATIILIVDGVENEVVLSPKGAQPQQMLPGLRMNNAKTVKAYASLASKIGGWMNVNRIGP